jgi:DNA-binding PadR family transcriptional regulator
MLEVAILGFVLEGPLHGYELRRRLAQLSGYARPVSDGSLYPAIDRMVRSGLLQRYAQPGRAAASRQVLHVTEAGKAQLLRRLRTPTELDITDGSRFFTILAFLSLLPDVADQHAVLRRRLAFLEQPASFFYEGDRPLRERDLTDPYRRGMLVIARATSKTERAWLHQVLDND